MSDRLQFNRYRLYVSDFDGSNFAAPVEIAELAGQPAASPVISSTGLEMFFNDGAGAGAQIIRAVRTSLTSPWQLLGYEAELNSGTDGWPTLSPDDLTIYWESDRTIPTGSIYSATRPAVGQPFGTPVQVPVLSNGGDAGDPDLASDGSTMLFDSARGGNIDIFVSMGGCS